MKVAYEVLAIYGALAIWGVLLVASWRRNRWWPFLGWGLAIALVLNVGYFVKGPPDAIAFFIGIYDVFDNVGLGRTEGAPALAACPDNACTVWGDRFVNHPSWGVAFHDRFLNGPQLRTNLLLGHIAFNTIAFILMHVQVLRPGTGANRTRHRTIGRVTFASLTLGTICALWMASEHHAVDSYGGIWAMLGFYSMSAFVYGTTIMGVRKARAGNAAGHKVWMIRALGSMWGAFWIFRVMLVVTGPLFRNYESVSLLLSIWLSAPLGILIAEWFRTRTSEAKAPSPKVMAPA